MIDYGKKNTVDGTIDSLGVWHKAALKVVDFKNKKVLDIGCGSGSFLSYIRKEAAEILGLDPNPAHLNLLLPSPTTTPCLTRPVRIFRSIYDCGPGQC